MSQDTDAEIAHLRAEVERLKGELAGYQESPVRDGQMERECDELRAALDRTATERAHRVDELTRECDQIERQRDEALAQMAGLLRDIQAIAHTGLAAQFEENGGWAHYEVPKGIYERLFHTMMNLPAAARALLEEGEECRRKHGKP